MDYTRPPLGQVSMFLPIDNLENDTLSESFQQPQKIEVVPQGRVPIQPEDLRRMSPGMQDPMLELLKYKLSSHRLESTVGQELLSYLQTYLDFKPVEALRFSSPHHDARIPPEANCTNELQALNSQPKVVDPAGLQLCLQEKRICPALPCLTEPVCTVEVTNEAFDLQQTIPANPFQHAIDSLNKRGHVFPLLLASCLSGSTPPAQENAVTYFEVPEPSALSTDLNEFKLKICTVGNPTVNEELRALLKAGRPITVNKGTAFTVAEQLVVLANYVLLMRQKNQAEGLSGSLTASEDFSDIIGGALKEPAPMKQLEKSEGKYFQFSQDGSVQLLLSPETRELLATALDKGETKLPEPRSIPLARPEEPAWLYTCVVAAVVPRTVPEATKNTTALGQQMTTTISISCDHCLPAQGLRKAGSLCDGCLQKAAVPGCTHEHKKGAPGSREPSLCDKCLQKLAPKPPNVRANPAPNRSVSIPICGKCRKTVVASFSGSWCRECKHGAATVSLCADCAQGLNRAAAQSVSGSLCLACTQAAAAAPAAPKSVTVSVSLCTNCEQGLNRAAAQSVSGSLCSACTQAAAAAPAAPKSATVSVSLCTNCEKDRAAEATAVSVSLCTNCEKGRAATKSVSGSLCPACTQAAAVSLCTNCEQDACKDCGSVSISCDLCSGKGSGNAMDSDSSAEINPRTLNKVAPFCVPSFSVYKPQESSGQETRAKSTLACFESFEVPANSSEPALPLEDIIGTCFDSISFDNPVATYGQNQQEKTSGANLVCTNSFSVPRDDAYKRDIFDPVLKTAEKSTTNESSRQGEVPQF